jgi:hypothetical protein
MFHARTIQPQKWFRPIYCHLWTKLQHIFAEVNKNCNSSPQIYETVVTFLTSQMYDVTILALYPAWVTATEVYVYLQVWMPHSPLTIFHTVDDRSVYTDCRLLWGLYTHVVKWPVIHLSLPFIYHWLARILNHASVKGRAVSCDIQSRYWTAKLWGRQLCASSALRS